MADTPKCSEENKMNNIIKNIAVLGFVYSLSSLAHADIDIEKIKSKSFDLATLIECAIKEENPEKTGKIDFDKRGYFVKCSLPDEALNAFAEASGSKIEKFGKEKYVFASIDNGRGIIAHLEKDKFYADKVDNLEAVKQNFYEMYKSESKIKQNSKQKVKSAPKPKPKAEKPSEEYINPNIEATEPEQKLEEKVSTEATEKTEEIPDYTPALGKVFEKNPVLSYLLHCKISNQQITDEDLKEYTELEGIYDSNNNIVDYSLKTSSPSADIELIKEAFGVDGDTITLNSRAYLRFYESKEGMIEVEKRSE